MGHYIPTAAQEQQAMLEAVGLSSWEELYADIPAQMRLDRLDLPPGLSELETVQAVEAMAAQNRVFSAIFRGAGAYRHFIPSIVQSVVGKEEFLTSYTPYQAEISQGVLQNIFEYQTMICELTGMAVANASVYDGASAAAEALTMCRDRKRQKALVSAAAHPMVIRTMETYSKGAGVELQLIPLREGRTDPEALENLLDDTVASVYLQQPNFFGQIEEAETLAEIAHRGGAKVIMGVNPIAAAVLKTPGECGADIAVGEGQPLGLPLSFGGPYLGFMACTAPLMRRLPGRIAGETVDADGRRAYVLTLQAREQHIRREKASSNICTNQALCAMTAAVYMASMGPDGMAQAARLCYSKAHYLARQLTAIPGVELVYPGEFFHEFVTTLPVAPDLLLGKLEEQDILGGWPVAGGILWCATECCTREEMDHLVWVVKEVCARG